jgi:hypothetical protein
LGRVVRSSFGTGLTSSLPPKNLNVFIHKDNVGVEKLDLYLIISAIMFVIFLILLIFKLKVITYPASPYPSGSPSASPIPTTSPTNLNPTVTLTFLSGG